MILYYTGIEGLIDVDQYKQCLNNSDDYYVEKYIISCSICGFIFMVIGAHGSVLCSRELYFWNDPHNSFQREMFILNLDK